MTILTHLLAFVVGTFAGLVFVLIATANSGPCDECPKLRAE